MCDGLFHKLNMSHSLIGMLACVEYILCFAQMVIMQMHKYVCEKMVFLKSGFRINMIIHQKRKRLHKRDTKKGEYTDAKVHFNN